MIIFREETVSLDGRDLPILLNPSSAEIGKLVREMGIAPTLRFTAIAKSKHLHVFDGDNNLHKNIVSRVPEMQAYHGIGDFAFNPSSVFTGVAIFKNSGLDLKSSDVFHSSQYSLDKIRTTAEYDWSWADRYFIGETITEFLEKEIEARTIKAFA